MSKREFGLGDEVWIYARTDKVYVVMGMGKDNLDYSLLLLLAPNGSRRRIRAHRVQHVSAVDRLGNINL